MEAKNFRVGNIINDYEANEGLFVVEEVKNNSQNNTTVFYRRGSFMSVNPDPAYLTGHIFILLGFKKDEIGYWSKGNSIYSFVKREGLGYMLVIADIEYKETYVKFVHELQNLFFALENTELDLVELLSDCG